MTLKDAPTHHDPIQTHTLVWMVGWLEQDARHPLKYRMLVGMVDTIFADVAQPDQVGCIPTKWVATTFQCPHHLMRAPVSSLRHALWP